MRFALPRQTVVISYVFSIALVLVPIAVAKTNTATTLTSSLNPSTYGQSLTFIATVLPITGTGTPTGTVTFSDGTQQTTKTLSGGRAMFTTSTLAAGSYSITATYNGDSNYNGSTSPILHQVVNKAPTTTSLISAPNPSSFGQQVIFTATVRGQYGAAVTGTVVFTYGSTSLCGSVSANSGGVATCLYSSLQSGADLITATYGGDSNNLGSSGSETQQVNPVLQSIMVSPQGLTVAIGSSSQQYAAEGFYNDGSQKDITNSVTWSSSNTSVATINSAGSEMPVSVGNTTIGASLSSIQGTSLLTVDAANTFFVAPNGNDAWSGTISAPNANNADGPFASPSRAQYAVEQVSKPAMVMLRNGTYYLALTPAISTPYVTNPGTLVLSASDSGSSATAQVMWQDYPGETPVISGGVPANADPVSGVGLHLSWSHTGNLYQATLPAALSNGVALQNFEYLYYNGQRRLRSRIHDGSSASMGYYMSNGNCVASPNTPPNQPAPTLSSCNLGTYLRLAPVTFSSPPSFCPYATSENAPYVYKCLDRFVYTDTANGDPITNWTNLNGTYSGIVSAPCTTSSNPYPVGDVEVTIVDAWTVDVMRVNCIDTTGKVIYLTGVTKGTGTTDPSKNYAFFGPEAGHRYIIENTYEAFRAAQTNGQVGIWFLDRHVSGAWVLNYIADTTHGEDPSHDNVVIPQLPQGGTQFPEGGQFPLVSGGQELNDYTGGSLIWATNLNYVTFSGVTFEIDNFFPSGTGFNNDVNGEMSVPQAIDCESCEHVTFNGVTLRHTSGSGILIASSFGYQGPAATADIVENSSFYDVGDSGVRVGHTPVTHGNIDNSLYVVNNALVQNNVIQGYSRVFPDGEGIAEGNGNSNQYLHNTITDGYHAGISICQLGCGPIFTSGSGQTSNVNGNNILTQYNLLSNLMQGITSDGGSLYYNVGGSVSSATGDQILNNVVYNTTDSYIIDNAQLVGYKVNGSAYGGEGIYLDAQSANVIIQNNVVFNVDGNAIHLTSGVPYGTNAQHSMISPNQFSNNIFSFADLSMLVQNSPWEEAGCPSTTVTHVTLSDNVFNFEKPNPNNSSFGVIQGCKNACGEDYDLYQTFTGNAYYNAVSDFSLDSHAFAVLSAQGSSGLDPKNDCLSSPTIPLSFDKPPVSCSWQQGVNGATCAGGNMLNVNMNEDPGGLVVPFGSLPFPSATGSAGDLPSDYLLTGWSYSNFMYQATNDTINSAGSSVSSPGTVPPTFPTYNYASF